MTKPPNPDGLGGLFVPSVNRGVYLASSFATSSASASG